MKIIIGIDDSPYSEAVLRWVKATPWPHETRFVVVSAVPVQIPAYSLIEVGPIRAVENNQQENMRAHEELVSQAERELKAAGFVVEGLALPGDPRELLIREAVSRGADMIVVGSHGRTGLSRLVVGSVATHVAGHAPCTVVIVKESRAHAARI